MMTDRKSRIACSRSWIALASRVNVLRCRSAITKGSFIGRARIWTYRMINHSIPELSILPQDDLSKICRRALYAAVRLAVSELSPSQTRVL